MFYKLNQVQTALKWLNSKQNMLDFAYNDIFYAWTESLLKSLGWNVMNSLSPWKSDTFVEQNSIFYKLTLCFICPRKSDWSSSEWEMTNSCEYTGGQPYLSYFTEWLKLLRGTLMYIKVLYWRMDANALRPKGLRKKLEKNKNSQFWLSRTNGT